MKPPPSKKARNATRSTDVSIEQIVEQAVLSDDAACESLLRRLTGFEKEVVDAVVVISKGVNASKICLRGPFSKVIREHFTLIGVSTTIDRLKEFHSFIVDSADGECVSNFVFLLGILISSSHALRHDKFRKEVCYYLPITVRTLWKNNKIAEACQTARILVEVLFAADFYHEESNSAEIWFSKTLSKLSVYQTMRRHPYMAALSMLLDSSHSDISDRIIELITLQELPTHEKNEAADLIVSFLPSYCSRCSNKQLQIFLEFVISKRSEEETQSLINKIRLAANILADDSFIWDVVSEAFVHTLAKELLLKHSEPLSIHHYLAEALRTLSFLEADNSMYSEAFNESVRNYFGHGIKTKWKIDEVFSSNEESLLNAFLSIPVQSLSAFASEQYAVVAVMVASRTQFTHEELFSSSIHVLGLLLSRSTKLHFLGDLHGLDHTLFESWCTALEGHSNASLVFKDTSKVIGRVIEVSCARRSDKEKHYLCPALTFFKGSGSTWCSWTQIIRFSALLVTTKWEALSKSSEEVQTKILEKIRNKYLCEILRSIDWKNADRVQASAERWSVIFSCWEDIPRFCRRSMVNKLLVGNDVKSLRKLTSSIIAGEFNFDKIVIDRALTFQLKYLPFVYERARNLENIIDWKVLLYLQRVGISLDVPISILSTERVLELLATCPSELEIKNEMLSIVAKLISPRLKSVATTCLVSLASIFERAKNCIEILSCAASALELFGHTDVERDIVVLCLGIASSQPLNDAVYNRIRGMQKVIQNAMLYAHHAVNNDQCALFAQLFVKVTKAVQRFIINKLGTAEQVDELIHALNSLAHNLTQHKVCYSRVVGPILSQIIKHSGKTELTVWKLSTISDKHSSSMLATNLPPAERLQYKRMFTAHKRMRKLIV